jgi:hypothetical protein
MDYRNIGSLVSPHGRNPWFGEQKGSSTPERISGQSTTRYQKCDRKTPLGSPG